MSFGDTLRTAREAKGLTCSQVAAQTRLLVQIVEEMEREDFHRIAAPIYGRGFVRLYAQCVGLDPIPLTAEFMELYEGRRAPVVKTRPQPSVDETPAPSAPTASTAPADLPPSRTDAPPAFAERPSPFSDDPFDLPDAPSGSPQPPDESASAPDAAVEPPPSVHDALGDLDLFNQPVDSPPRVRPTDIPPPRVDSPYLSSYTDAPRPSAAARFSAGLSNVSHGVISTVRRIPRSAWRFSILVLGALLVLTLVIFACTKLYQLTTPKDTPPPVAPAPSAETTDAPTRPTTAAATDTKTARPTPPKKPGKLTTTGEKIPALYID